MKRILFIFLSLLIATAGMAQGIDIEAHGSLAKAIKRAQKENKLVFVDCMASWCQPCKKLAAEVFTLPEVGEYFNAHYVSIQLDMERDADGIKNIKQWGIKSFPTMMFIDPATGNPVGRVVGLVDGKALIEAAQRAFDPTTRVDNLVAQFNNGRHDLPFVVELVKQLAANGLQDQVTTVMETVLSEQPVDTLAKPQVWMLVMQFENDPLSKPLQAVKQNLDKFYAMPIPNAKELVDAKLGSAALTSVMSFCQSPNLAAFQQQRYNDLVDYVAQMPDDQWKTACSVWLNTSMRQRKGDWQGMLDAIREVHDGNVLQPQVWAQYFMTYLKAIPTMKEGDKATKATLALIDEMYKEANETDAAGLRQLMEKLSAQALLYQAQGNASKLQKLTKEMQRLMPLAQQMAAGGQPGTSGAALAQGAGAEASSGYTSPFAASTNGNPLGGNNGNPLTGNTGNPLAGNTGNPLTTGSGNTEHSTPLPSGEGAGREARLMVSPGGSVLPYELRQGAPTVAVVINGHTYHFLFDTCAGYTCVTDRLVTAEKLPYAQTGNRLAGMDGTLTMAAIPQLKLGTVTVSNAVAAIMPEGNDIFRSLKVDGIIGAPIISQFCVTFDSKTRQITLTDEADDAIKGWKPLQFAGIDPVITARIKSTTEGFIDVPMLFDSGNGSGSAALPSVEGFEQWRDNGLITDTEEGQGFAAMMITGMNAAGNKLYRGRLNDYKIGDGTFTGIPVLCGGPAGYMIMCYRLTDLGRLTLDYAGKRFAFEAYKDVQPWDRDRRPVLTGSFQGHLKVAAVYGKEVMKALSVGDEIVALGDHRLEGNLPLDTPNVDVLITTGHVTTVTVRGKDGKEKQLPASLFTE